MYDSTKGFFLLLLLAASLGLWVVEARADEPKDKGMTDRKLSQEQERIIVCKGTERPFTGKYWDHHETGTYQCLRCGEALFPSEAKFDSGSGWPSFDRTLPGAVREIPDSDGSRTEIVCAKCGAHLGHVFVGEGFTERSTRHCVNSVSLDFEPAAEKKAAGSQEAFFAGGCFWGVEHLFQQEPGVMSAESGYMGGRVENPTYEQVCGHGTGHVETVRVVFDPSRTSYEKLARFFFEIHDPTQVDRQGPDRGEQYRSAIFTSDAGEKKTVEGLISLLERKGMKVATKIEPAGPFWPAEDYHQNYLLRHEGRACHHHRVNRFGDE